jgi:hypothetical protein
MRRTLLLLAACVALLAGCGQSEKDKYIEAYSPLNTRLVKVNDKLARTINASGEKSNAQVAREFAPLGTQLGTLSKEIRALDTPTDLQQESKALTRSLDRTQAHVEALTAAARKNDSQGLATASTELPAEANNISNVANALARATGANVGG